MPSFWIRLIKNRKGSLFSYLMFIKVYFLILIVVQMIVFVSKCITSSVLFWNNSAYVCVCVCVLFLQYIMIFVLQINHSTFLLFAEESSISHIFIPEFTNLISIIIYALWFICSLQFSFFFCLYIYLMQNIYWPP